MGRWERCGELREIGKERTDGLFFSFLKRVRQKMGSSTKVISRGSACYRMGYRAKSPKSWCY